MDDQVKACLGDAEFQTGATKINRSFTVHISAQPDHGVTDDYWWGFKVPEMSQPFTGEANAWETDYLLEGDYETWGKVNARIEQMVPLLMNKKISVPRGSISYIARFVPTVNRYWDLSKAHTTSYAGDFSF
jgi:hypothetical protein